MIIYISILRGINVGGHNQLKMEVLREMYVKLGYTNVQTYIQSGNVIFCAQSNDKLSIEKKIIDKIRESFEINVQVMILTIDELRNALKNNPFISDSSKNPAYLHLTFLSVIPKDELLIKISTGNYSPDEYHYSDKTIYLFCPIGYGNTKLNNAFFENKLKLIATTRNLKTATELLAIALKI